MAEPIRVLHVLGRLNMGGAESRIMDLYRHMDRSQVQFDFLVHYRLTEDDRRSGADTDTETLLRLRPEEDFDAEARALGARIYVLPRFTGTNLPEYRRACRVFFSAHHGWSVIEGHMTSMASIYLPIAKAAGVPVTIAHARSAGVDSGLRGAATRLLRRPLPKRCDIMMSCSEPASVSVFGKKAAQSGRILTVPNALDLKAYRFDPALRQRTRQEYGIAEETVVIGHVGRFDPVKNQAFLAKVGALLAEHTPGPETSGTLDPHRSAGNRAGPGPTGTDTACGTEEAEGKTQTAATDSPAYLFLFVGEGKLQDTVRQTFEEAGLGDAVLFAGLQPREKTAALYQAFDLFALPSLYEGLPGTVIEAQSAGLPCLIADTITDEVAITDLVNRLPLSQPERWAQAAARRSGAGADRQQACADALAALREAGYEIESAAARMQNFYLHPEKGLE